MGFLASFIGLWASSYSVVLASLLASQQHIRALGEKYFAIKSYWFVMTQCARGRNMLLRWFLPFRVWWRIIVGDYSCWFSDRCCSNVRGVSLAFGLGDVDVLWDCSAGYLTGWWRQYALREQGRHCLTIQSRYSGGIFLDVILGGLFSRLFCHFG